MRNPRMSRRLIAAFVVFCVFGATYGKPPDRAGWVRREVDWRVGSGMRIRAVRHPVDRPVPLRAVRRTRSPARSPATADAKAAPLGAHPHKAGEPAVGVDIIDSPPIAGFVPWIVVTVTNDRLGDLEIDAVPRAALAGSFLTTNPGGNYAIGIFDTGAGAHVMGHGAATELGLFAQGWVTLGEIEVSGVTGSVMAWVSQPLGLFIDGLDAVDPQTLELDYSGVVGEGNVSIAVGQGGDPDLPTAIGTPLSVFYTTVILNDRPITVVRDGVEYTGPTLAFFEPDDPAIPTYPQRVPLELRPSGVAVQYFPCLEPLFTCPGGDGSPLAPSVIMGGLQLSGQSLFFVSSVDVYDGGYSALDNDGFMLDTGAQVTVIGQRIGARLGLDPAAAEFTVEIQGVDGQVVEKPGFYVDALEIAALGGWLRYTNVPVVLLDVASPEGGTLDGIIGMNLMIEYNLILRGGGLQFGIDPVLELQHIEPSLPGDADGDGDVDLQIGRAHV